MHEPSEQRYFSEFEHAVKVILSRIYLHKLLHARKVTSWPGNTLEGMSCSVIKMFYTDLWKSFSSQETYINLTKVSFALEMVSFN